MFVLSNLIVALSQVADFILLAYMWIVIISALISWVNPDPYNPIVRFLYKVTEPVYYRIRKIIPLRLGFVDITPMIVILIIVFLRYFLIQTLLDMAYRIH